MADFDLNLAREDHVEEFLRRCFEVRSRCRVGEKGRARDVERSLLRQDAEFERWHRARGIAEAHEQPERLQTIERAGEGAPADRVVDDRYPLSTSHLADAL